MQRYVNPRLVTFNGNATLTSTTRVPVLLRAGETYSFKLEEASRATVTLSGLAYGAGTIRLGIDETGASIANTMLNQVLPVVNNRINATVVLLRNQNLFIRSLTDLTLRLTVIAEES